MLNTLPHLLINLCQACSNTTSTWRSWAAGSSQRTWTIRSSFWAIISLSPGHWIHHYPDTGKIEIAENPLCWSIYSRFFLISVFVNCQKSLIPSYHLAMASNYLRWIMPNPISTRSTNSIPSGLYAGRTHGISCKFFRMEGSKSKGIEMSWWPSGNRFLRFIPWPKPQVA